MSKLQTDDQFMYQNASTTDAMQASYENQLLGDRVCIDDATPAEWDALPRGKQEPMRDGYDQVNLDYNTDFVDLTTPQEREAILDLLAEKAQEDGLYDNVDKPSHYNTGNIECIEAIEEALTDEEIRGYFKGNCLKYLWREQYKNGLEDLKKARWYLDRLIKRLEKG
mgnify:CR=1 FL=1